MANRPGLSKIHYQIIEVLKANPSGISEGEMRVALQLGPDEMVQFGRRRRQLHAYYHIEKRRDGKKFVYIYRGERSEPLDANPIDDTKRARALHAAQGRCQMCGRTVAEHRIVLVIDHRVPREWHGPTEGWNLWAICEQCNHGKKNLFASMDSPAVRAAMTHQSVHVRLGELLKAVGVGTPIPSSVLEFVAMDQDDWRKRLRELRYLRWEIPAARKTMPDGRVRSSYTLRGYTQWPKNPTQWIRRYEVARRDDPAVFAAMRREAASFEVRRK